MSLQDKMTSLANNVRKLSWQTDKLGLDGMNTLLSNMLVYNSTMPYIIMNDGTGTSTINGEYQCFTFNDNRNIVNCNYYAKNWDSLQFNIDNSVTIVQSFTITTDAKVDMATIHMYSSSTGNKENILDNYTAKVADNTYRIYSKATSNTIGTVKLFNFNLSLSNCNYLKFSEPYLGIIGGSI